MAVAVFFAVGFVMLVVVAHQIVQCEAVVSGYEVDACIGKSAIARIEIARTGQTESQRAHLPGISLAEAPHRIAIGGIPFGPKNRKIADLIASRSKVPRLGD